MKIRDRIIKKNGIDTSGIFARLSKNP